MLYPLWFPSARKYGHIAADLVPLSFNLLLGKTAGPLAITVVVLIPHSPFHQESPMRDTSRQEELLQVAVLPSSLPGRLAIM